MIARTLFTAIFALAATSLAAAAPPRWAADVPLLDCDGVPCIDARIDDLPAGRMLIDTGNIVSLVGLSHAAEIGFDPHPGPDGSLHAVRAVLGIGDTHIDDVPAIAAPIDDYVARGQIAHAAGTLSFTAFKNRIVQLDFAAHRFRVSAPMAAPASCEAGCAPLRRIAFGHDGPPILVADGFALGGRAIVAQVDTVFTGPLVVYDASAARLGLAETSTAPTDHFAFIDGGVDMRRIGPGRISFAGHDLGGENMVYLPMPGVHQPDGLFDATIGLGLMRGRVVTLDFHAMTISVAPGTGAA